MPVWSSPRIDEQQYLTVSPQKEGGQNVKLCKLSAILVEVSTVFFCMFLPQALQSMIEPKHENNGGKDG